MNAVTEAMDGVCIRVDDGGVIQMNKKRREKLSLAISAIEHAEQIIDFVKDDEELALDNIPENLRDLDKASAMEDAVEHLGEALDHVRQAQEEIEQAING